jgi:modification methylase
MTHHRIIFKSSVDMTDVPHESVDLVMTSPPYNVGKDYGNKEYDDWCCYEDYIGMLRLVFGNCFNKLKQYRYCCVNVARDSNVPLSSDITRLMCDIGFKYNKRIVWVKPEGAANQTMTMLFPFPRYYEPKLVTEDILLFTKGDINGNRGERLEGNRIEDRFLRSYPTNVWAINPVSLDCHPCPYPEQLVENVIRFYSNVGDCVLDPFLGSGTTTKVARVLCRDSIGYEINKDYKGAILDRTGLSYVGLSDDTFEVICDK